MTTPSKRPYLLRALYEWMVDASLTPYLLVDASIPGVEVPEAYVEDGRIVLNISPNAVRELHIDNDLLSFDGRFDGVARQVFVPMAACLAVYARESGEGMMFDDEVQEGAADAAAETAADADASKPETSDPESGRDKPTGKHGSHLKVIK